MSFLEDGHAALEWAARYLERVPELPVLAQVEPGEIRARLPTSPPEGSEPFSAVLRDLDEILLPGITHWQHPRYFAYFAVTASEPAILAELLAAALNPVAILWRTAPASTELEGVVADWVAQLLGLPAGWHGHIEDSASTSTLAAVIAARHVTGRNTVVCSEHAHSSVEKAARMLGMELRKVPVDDAFRLRADALDLDDAAIVVVVNAHKWMLTPMDCSLLWTSRREDFRSAFSLVPEYLRTPDSEDALSLSEYGPALGRRFRSLKLWAVLRCYGREGLQRVIREHVRLAERFEGWVREEPGWEVCAPRPFSVVCFRRDVSDEANEALLERVNATGEIFISHTRLNGRYVLRLAIGNERTTEDDVGRAWDVIRHAAKSNVEFV
jgi:aromatic-L-amino-acid decarboxylase